MPNDTIHNPNADEKGPAMATMIERDRRETPPMEVVAAVLLTLIMAIAFVLIAAFWPDLEERITILTVSIILSVLMALAARWLWNGSRWGAFATLGLQAVSILLSIPAFFDDEAAIVVMNVVAVVASVLVIVAVLSPASRGFWNVRRR